MRERERERIRQQEDIGHWASKVNSAFTGDQKKRRRKDSEARKRSIYLKYTRGKLLTKWN